MAWSTQLERSVRRDEGVFASPWVLELGLAYIYGCF